MRIEVVRDCGDDPVRQALADLFERMAPALASLPELAGVDADVRLTLGSEDTCRLWDVDPRALGFHAVMSGSRSDPEADWEDQDEVETYREVNERHEAVVNLDAFEGAVEDWDALSDREREHELESYAATAAHELAHVLEWVRETGGRTPDEVFVAGKGELAIKDTYDAIEARLSAGGGTEDHAERLGRDLTAAVFHGFAAEAMEAIEAAMSKPSPRP